MTPTGRSSSHWSYGIQKEPEKPIVFVHVDDLKLCPGPQDISWVPGVPTAKSLCASTVAFRPGSHVSDMTPDPSVDVSDWDETNYLHTSTPITAELDRPFDITGHVLSPLYYCQLDYQDSRFHSIAHLMCYRYAIVNDQRTFATGIRKWSKHLTDFPTPKLALLDCVQQWITILGEIYSHLCLTDTAVKAALVDTGPRPFTLECLSPWGCVLNDPDVSSRTDIISDVLVSVRVAAVADKFTRCHWLERTMAPCPGTRRVRRLLAERILVQH